MKNLSQKPKLILIDSHALIHRAYHALPSLATQKGEVLNAVFGYVSVFLKILKEMKPEYIVAAFDLPQPTFRHEEFEEYKAHRPKAPDELIAQFNKVKEVMRAFGVPVMEMPGYEADDVLGTICEKVKSASGRTKLLEVQSIILTGDLDTLQLVDDEKTVVYTLKKGITDTVIYDEKAVFERYGLRPNQMVDFKGLKGDPSDNIPGVPGVGDKTASALVSKYGTLEEIFKEISSRSQKSKVKSQKKEKQKEILSDKLIEKLVEYKDQAFLSKKLSTIRCDAPINFNLEDARVGEFSAANKERVEQLLKEMEFYSLANRLPWKEGKNQNVIRQLADKNQNDNEKLKNEKIPSNDNQESVNAVKEKISKATEIAILQKFDDENFLGVEMATNDKEYFFIKKESLKELKDIFENKEIEKIGYNLKSLIKILREYDIELRGIDFDIMLAAYVLNPGEREYPLEKIKNQKSKIKITTQNLKSEIEIESEKFFADDLFELKAVLEKEIEAQGLKKVFYEIEMPLIDVLAQMEISGIKIDVDYLKKFSVELAEKLKNLEKKIYDLAGEEFNINSPQQISKILFEKLKIEVKGIRKTPGGAISTKASELEKLRGSHPIADSILDYREIFKLKSTYVDALPKMVNAKDGRIHTNYNQTGTSTGRLSSLEPNLQNIPIRTDLGASIRRAFVADSLNYKMPDARISQATDRAVFNPPTGGQARKEAQGITTQMVFRNSKKGYKLVAFDYSQIELRLASVIAKDEKMLAAFKEGKDIHLITAAEIFNMPIEKVDDKMRRAAKTLNFGVLYGMSAKSFSETAKIEYKDAKKFINEYFSDFSGIANYIQSTVQKARELGYVETLFGRRRYIPEILSGSWQIKQAAERMAANMPIQGTAADIIKSAMVKIYRDLSLADRDDARMLLQIHDELVFEIKEEAIKKQALKIKEIMENVVDLEAPLLVEAEYGDNLGEMLPLF